MLVSLFLQEMGSHLHMGSKVGKGKQSPEFTRCLEESEAAAEGTERGKRQKPARMMGMEKPPKHQKT